MIEPIPYRATLVYAPRYAPDGRVEVDVLRATPDGGLRVRRVSDGLEYEVLGYERQHGLVEIDVAPE